MAAGAPIVPPSPIPRSRPRWMGTLSHARGLRRLTLLVAGELRRGTSGLSPCAPRPTTGTGGRPAIWMAKAQPIAEPIVDPRSGARCVIRDTRAAGCRALLLDRGGNRAKTRI
jgi:hypothetical protein